jgi:hypothetical protein
MVMLVVIGRNAEKLRKKYQQDVEKSNQDMERVFAELRDELINGVNRGFDTPTGILSKAGMTEGRIKGLEEKLNRELAAYEEEIRKVINTNQIEIIDAYKSCLIPPKELSDPTRIGQANPAGRYYEKLLEQMRGISDDDLDKNKEKLLAEHIEKVERHIKSPLNAEERIAEIRRVMDIIKRARAMNDADFACSRVDLAAEMEYQKKSEMLKQQIQNLQRELSRSGEREGERAKLGALTKVGGFLLNPKLPELLLARLKKSRTFVKTPLVNLEELEAGTCETESPATPEKK